MDPKLVAILSLRAVGTVMRLQGLHGPADAIDGLIRAYEAGRNVDDYLQEIADKLKDGQELDSWVQITDRINQEVDEFLSRDESGQAT